MYIQGVESIYDLEWAEGVKYGDMRLQFEYEFSKYSFEIASREDHFAWFDMYEKEALRALEAGLAFPAYDYVLKCSHTFNVLDARGAISVTERQSYILRVRDLSKKCAEVFVETRRKLGFPLLKKEDKN